MEVFPTSTGPPTSEPRFPSPGQVVAAVPLASRSAAEFGGGGGEGGYIYGGFPKMVVFPNNFHGVFIFLLEMDHFGVLGGKPTI